VETHCGGSDGGGWTCGEQWCTFGKTARDAALEDSVLSVEIRLWLLECNVVMIPTV